MQPMNRRDFVKLGVAVPVAGAATSPLGLDLTKADDARRAFRIAGAKQSHSICPYCAVGCSLVAYTRTGSNGRTEILQIEGDPDSPVNEGRLCPKGASAMQLATSSRRVGKPMRRAPGSDHWEELSWDAMLDALALRIKAARDATFVTEDADGNVVNRCEGIAFAGGAAFSTEEGYFAAKVMRALGVTHLEQQARV
jgi:formate dehydrogenase major subunit